MALLYQKPEVERRYKVHRAKWQDCTACKLCELRTTRSKVVLYRGSLPCDILFVGEAPGSSETVTGEPFRGPGGQLLNALIADEMMAFRCVPGYTNIVSCIPLNPDPLSSGTLRPPNKLEAISCRPRLLEIFKLAQPKGVVLLGDIPKRMFPKFDAGLPEDAYLHLAAPNQILRKAEESMQLAANMEKRFTLDLNEFLRRVL